MAVMEELNLSENMLQRVLETNSEPEWMRAKRMAAWEKYESLPMPSGQEEEWRRTSLKDLKADEIIPFTPGPRKTGASQSTVVPTSDLLKEVIRRNVTKQKPLLVQQNGETIYYSLPDAWKEKGVIFLPLEEAAIRYPDLVAGHFMKRGLQADEDKFLALHGALWGGGLFLYVPPKVALDESMEIYFYLDRLKGGSFPHNLVVLDSQSQATFVEYYLSAPLEGQIFHDGGAELYLYPHARLSYAVLHDWQDNIFNVSNYRVLMERDSQLDWMVGLCGSRISKAHYETLLLGEGADCRMSGIMFGSKRNHLDVFTLMDHISPHTVANLLYKGVVRDRARAIFQGNIKIRREALQTDSYLANRNLVLSNRARVDTMPRLEIDNNDVRASHGASVGYVEESEIFYLMSRGIPRKEAEKMIVEAFLGPLFNKISSNAAREFWQAGIEARLGNAS